MVSTTIGGRHSKEKAQTVTGDTIVAWAVGNKPRPKEHLVFNQYVKVSGRINLRLTEAKMAGMKIASRDAVTEDRFCDRKPNCNCLVLSPASAL